jgi:glycosyltransferase involved in cell wall biosynthesis
MKRLRICLLVSDMARNAFGRAYILARVLARDYDVQVVGPQFGRSVWPPMAGLLEQYHIPVTAIRAHSYPRYHQAARQVWQAIKADVLYPLKPYPTSFGLALRYRRAHRIPLVLDVDDWELGVYAGRSRRELLSTVLKSINSPNNYLWLRMLYNRINQADAVTVSSCFLHRQYGGVIVPHGRDTAVMDPAQVEGEAVRQKWQLKGKVVMFLGTPRPHKGVEDLIAAVHRLGRDDVTGLIVGVNENEPYGMHLQATAGPNVRLMPIQPFEEIPALLMAADVVVIPQRQTPFGEAQVPAKIFDAMAMARPIVSTAISDIPQILDGCGLVVPPGDVAGISAAIAQLLDSPEEAARLGQQARARCVAEYSWDAMQKTLKTTIDHVSKR